MSEPRIAPGGKGLYGARVGILMLETRFPRIPGDMGNALTWPFPVLYKVVPGASPRRVVYDKAQGLLLTESFYWDLNDQTRGFSRRFAKLHKGAMPTMGQAGVYSSVLHYLKAVEAAKTDDGTKVVAKMKELPTDDPLFGKGRIRADGRKMHNAYLVEVKKPSESKGPYDYEKVLATIPAEQAFRPLNQGDCPLVK